MSRNRRRRAKSTRAPGNRAPFQKVVVATDFSRSAQRAAERAARLLSPAGGRLILLHVVPPEIPAEYLVAVEGEARAALVNVKRRLALTARKAGNRKLAVVPVVRVGLPWLEIVRLARSEKAGLIVLGRHGRRVIRDLFLGATAEKVIRKSSVPVLVVNLKPSSVYRRPLIALDLKDRSRSTVELALRTLGREVREVFAIHVYTVPFEGLMMPRLAPRELMAYQNRCKREAVSGLRRVLESAAGGIHWKSSVRRGAPREVIPREVAAARADLVILGTHGRSRLSHALLGSVAEYVVRTARCDVLVAPPASAALR